MKPTPFQRLTGKTPPTGPSDASGRSPSGLRFRAALEGFSNTIWDFADSLWKVWRWFSAGLLGLVVFDAGADPGTLLFAIGMDSVGIVALASWLFSSQLRGTTARLWSSGAAVQVSVVVLLLLFSIGFAVAIWAYTTAIALRVFAG